MFAIEGRSLESLLLGEGALATSLIMRLDVIVEAFSFFVNFSHSKFCGPLHGRSKIEQGLSHIS